MISFPRFCVAAIGFVSLFSLAGCEAETDRTVVAWINGEKVSGTEYNERVQTVTAIPPAINTDAGGLTMINVIRDRLTEQLARKYKAVPGNDVVSQEADYRLHADSSLANSIVAGRATESELMREIKFEMEAVGIGTNGDRINDQVLQKEYDDIVAGKKPQEKRAVFQSVRYTLKALQVPDAAIGAQVITELKKTGSFKTATANIPNISPLGAADSDKEQFATEEQAPPELRAALESLKPNEIAPTPVVIRVPNPTQPLNPQIYYVVVQFIRKENAVTLPFSQARVHLEQEMLKQNHPEWADHYRHELGNFSKVAQIRIGIDRYQGLLDSYVRPQAVNAAAAPPPSMTPGAPQ